MKKIKVGLPRALMYYKNNVFWQQFLRKMNCKVIVGPAIDKNIISLGSKYTIKNTCQPYKAYIGEAVYLEKICDYILITRIDNYKSLEVCPKFKSTYDDLKKIIPQKKILNNNINYKRLRSELIEALKIGFRINKNPIVILYSYIYAQKKQKKFNLTRQLENQHKINKNGKKVLIISEFYNLENSSIISQVIELLNNYGIIYLFSNYLDSSLATQFSEYFTEELKLKNENEALGSLYYYQYQINGVILISQPFCPINNIINSTLIMRKNLVPIINIEVNNNDDNIKNKITSLINLIKRNTNE